MRAAKSGNSPWPDGSKNSICHKASIVSAINLAFTIIISHGVALLNAYSSTVPSHAPQEQPLIIWNIHSDFGGQFRVGYGSARIR